MIDTRLIMLEGLPTTGKSTNSDFLRMQFERNGKKVKWAHEVACPHPTLFFSEACFRRAEYDDFLKAYPETADILNSIAIFRKNAVGIDLLEIEWNYADVIGDSVFEAIKKFDGMKFTLDRYEEAASGKWEYFAETAIREKETVYILDSSIFQYQIFTFLLNNASYERLEKFVNKLCNSVRHLNPSLIYLYRENIEDTIDYFEKDRGPQALKNIWQQHKTSLYYQGRLEGREGGEQFLKDYANSARLLFDSLDCRKLSVEITKADWTSYEGKILSFAGIKNIPSPKFLPPSGIYRNEEFDYQITVDGLMIIDPDGNKKKLTPKTASEFYAECLPMVLSFEKPEQIIMTGSQICAHWSKTGMVYKKTGLELRPKSWKCDIIVTE